MNELAGKTAVVTGGASGIGFAIAQRLAAEKMQLVIVDVEVAALAAAERALADAGAQVLAVQADVANGAAMDGVAEAARARFGLVHVIVNNAGVGGGAGPMWTLSEADWRWTLDVNLWGVIHGIRAFLPALVASGEPGHVVNTASMAGLTSTPFLGPYTATKHAVVAISEVLAKELELAGAQIGVSVLCPGFVKTKIASSDRNRPDNMKGVPNAASPAGNPKMAEAMNNLVAMGLPPETIAERVVAAIREPRFYILTHPEMKPAIEYRFHDILEERPPGIDPLFRQLGAAIIGSGGAGSAGGPTRP